MATKVSGRDEVIARIRKPTTNVLTPSFFDTPTKESSSRSADLTRKNIKTMSESIVGSIFIYCSVYHIMEV